MAGDEPRQIGRHRPGRRRDRHVVVVEDDDEPRAHRPGVVHRLIGHAGRHGAVADDGHDIVDLVRKIARHRHAEGGGDRGRRMAGAEGVVFAFRAFGEARKAAALAQRANAGAPPGQDLVGVGLMADVPDDAVGRGVEYVVERHGQLDDAEPGSEMTAGHRNRADRLGAKFFGEPRELALAQPAQVGGRGDLIQQRRRRLRHVFPRIAGALFPAPPRRFSRTPIHTPAAIALQSALGREARLGPAAAAQRCRDHRRVPRRARRYGPRSGCRFSSSRSRA